MAAAIADHKLDVYDAGGLVGGDLRDVQVDCHAAGAVRVDLIGAGFLPRRREVGSREVVASVITLREVAMAVEHLDAGDDLRRRRQRTVRKRGARLGGSPGPVFAFEGRVGAPEIVTSSRPSGTA